MNDQLSLGSETAKRQILVVDDDKDFADSLSNLLILEGFEVAAAYTTSEALTKLDQFPASVALIDIRLGDRTGLDLVSDVGRHHPDVLCVLMTAYASAETAIEALQAGAYDYLCKPFFSEDLLATLNRCFERINLTKSREQAEEALWRRNLELEEINQRLHGVVASIYGLSGCSTVLDLCILAAQEITRNLQGCNTAVYLSEDDKFIDQSGACLTPETIRQWSECDLIHEVLKQHKPLSSSSLTGARTPSAKSPENQKQLGELMGFPLIGESQRTIGVLAIRSAGGRTISKQDRELAVILVSFANEAIRLVQARERLAQSEGRLRNIIDNSPSLISLKDSAGRFLVVNKCFEIWHGHKQEAVIGKTSAQVFSNPIANLYATQFDEVKESGKHAVQELEIPFADGAPHTVLVTKFPVLGADGRPIAVGTIGTDITERKRTEERLRQAQKMEVLGQLTRGIAHDFNNILAVISGNLDLIKDELQHVIETRELVEDAMSAAESGAALTNRWLAFGRRQVLRPESTDASKLISGMYRMLERTFDETMTIEHNLSDDLWPIMIDRNQLETSLLNLAINARDAMPAGGELTFQTVNVGLEKDDLGQESNNSGDYVQITVQDTGTGMSPEVSAQAIQPFYTTKDVGRGSGLGLSMVHGFVQQSGGHLQILSSPGEGTVVNLFLPRAEAAVSEKQFRPYPSLSSRGNGERILVVEDRHDVRKTARTMLTRLGYDVLEAADGETALNLLADIRRIDLLFTDVVLPGGMNGIQLARMAKSHCPTLKVLCTSGYPDDESFQTNPEDDGFVFVKKPYAKDELAFRVRQALDADFNNPCQGAGPN